jgi:hypothetical protein
MKKYSTFRKKQKHKKTARKSSQAKKYRHKKTNKNKKIFKGGFSAAQFAGALAVAAATGMNKIVLIPNEAGKVAKSKRYDFIFDMTNKPVLGRSSGKATFKIPGTSSNVNIKNYDIYVGSQDSDLLIKIYGNDSVIKRLASITQTIIQPQNAIALINTAEQNGQITQAVANDLQQGVEENLTGGTMLLGNETVQPDNSAFIKYVQFIFNLLLLFFQLLFSIIFASKNQEPMNQEQEPMNQEANTPASTPNQVVAIINNEPSAEETAENINDTLNYIGELPQFRDTPDTVEPEPAVDNRFKCVNPYTRSNATTRDRIKSCNKIGPSNENFTEREWRTLQPCIEECYND